MNNAQSRQIFEDNIRPADLLLKVFRLLEHDAPTPKTRLVEDRCGRWSRRKDEGLIVIYNEIFLGLIRERAEVPPASIKHSALCNLLRQSVVTASTALETYPPNLAAGQSARSDSGCEGGISCPRNDEAFKDQFKELKFDLDEAVRIFVDPDPLFVANKMISSLNFSYLNGRRGIHITGVLLCTRQSMAARFPSNSAGTKAKSRRLSMPP